MTDKKRRYYSQLIELLRTADVAIELADARFIAETRIPKLERRFGKKLLLVASKSDLVPRAKREPHMIYFSARTREGVEEILGKAKEIGRNNTYRRTKDIKMVIFGIPNVGKSSLINALRKKYSAKTGFRAGLTHGPQWIRLSDELMLCDTAGVVEFGEDEKSLAMKSALDVTDLKRPEQAAVEIISRAFLLKPNPILKFYKIEKAEDAEDFLTQMAIKRGLLGKGATPLVSEAAMVLIRDYQKGKFLLR